LTQQRTKEIEMKNLRCKTTRFYLNAIAVFCLSVSVGGQTGGVFTITKSVISGGGGRSTGGTFTLDGTIGQPIAGTSSTGGTFDLKGGFWTPSSVVETASIGGRVITSTGRGLADVLITVVDDEDNPVASITTTSFGFFTIPDLPVGRTYILTAQKKRYRMDPANHFITLDEDVTGVNFVATPSLR
jgi:hypothetical protein